MKKLFLVLSALMLVCFMASGALAYGINNLTQVQDQNGNWYAVGATIGDPAYFKIGGANYNSGSNTLTFFTNWNPSKDGYLGVSTGDLFIDYNGGGWDLSIGLDTNPNGQGLSRANAITNLGNVYTGSIQYSFITIAGTYGYNFKTGSDPAERSPVLMNNFTNTTTPVVWGAGDSDYQSSVAVTLPGYVGDNFRFFWSPSTCSNGPMEGAVPLPGAVLLLGAGMARLVAYARRRQD
jgi:hypothetical protein